MNSGFDKYHRPKDILRKVSPEFPDAGRRYETNFAVNGSDATWVNGVFHEFTEYTRSHRSRMSWLHRHTVYDVLLWILGSRSRSGAMRAPRR